MYKRVLQTIVVVALSVMVHPLKGQSSNSITEGYSSRKLPRMVVIINAEQLRHDYLYKFSKNFGDGGIKRMMNEGISYSNARYNYMFTQGSPGIATIMTGTQPSQHGIIGDGWINYTTNQKIAAAADNTQKGIGCNEDEGMYSPANLLVSTVGDELKRHSPASKVVSVAINPESAVFAASKSGDAAYWFDQRYGSWATSSYYMADLPQWVKSYNETDKKKDYLSQLWHLSIPYDRYLYKAHNKVALDDQVRISFDALFGGGNQAEYSQLSHKPMGNSYATDFAIEAIKNESMGTDDNAPDMLVVNYGVIGNLTTRYGIESMDVEDAIYRLDKNIETLLDYLDTVVGKENYVALFTSNHGTSDNIVKDKGLGGKFNSTQFKVLIGGFMNAQHGTGEWVSEFRNRQLYLNRRLIFDRGLSLSEIQNSVATFALQFGGVAQCITATALQNNYYGKSIMQKIQNSFFPKHSGDVIINLLPGWIEIEGEEDKSIVVSASGSPYEYDTHVPLIWRGSNLVGKVVHRPIDMTNVAATVAELLSIPHPNASEGSAIEEVITELN